MSVQTVDPRIALELEKLNNSCEKINNLEVNLGKKIINGNFLILHSPTHRHTRNSIFFGPYSR